MKNDDIIDDDLFGECMHYWVICSCIHKCWVGCLYPYWRQPDIYIPYWWRPNTLYSYWRRLMILLYLEVTTSYQMHIELCLERIAYIRFYVNMCIGELCHYVN